jgi:hypothetical protein
MAPIMLSITLCVTGYAVIALIQLPNSAATLANDAARDEERLAARLERPQPP